MRFNKRFTPGKVARKNCSFVLVSLRIITLLMVFISMVVVGDILMEFTITWDGGSVRFLSESRAREEKGCSLAVRWKIKKC